MKVSLNYLKQYLDFDLPGINELADVIGSRLGAMEEQPVNLSDVYKDVIIVKVVECKPIADSDHLNLCLVDDGHKKDGVERNDQGLIQVVCGAPNVKAGMMAAWLPPGAIVPSTYFKDQFKLEARQLRGQTSNGMLASSKELNLSEDHEGLLVVDPSTNPGDSFLKVYQLDDYLIDIENKMFTHRPDCFGQLGVAREVAGILGHRFKSPEWYLNAPSIETSNEFKISVQNEIPSKVPRFSVVVIDNIEIKPSPMAVQSYLSRLGVRPINNIVDLTNIVMLETGQPLHAYDYDKLKSLANGGEVVISTRLPRPSEAIMLLNGKEVKPTPESIGIAVNDHLIGLGGVMGGRDSEVDENTKTIVLEAATFDMYDIRRTSMELGLFSEAVTRFTKGQSPLQTLRILGYAISRLTELAPGSKVASAVVDDVHLPEATIKRDSIHPAITVSADFINKRLGTTLSEGEITSLLQNVECQVEINTNELSVTAPFWRTDLEIREDVVEEVGRLYGFENIKPVLLEGQVRAVTKNKDLESKSDVRHLLASAGANELLTYSFISKKLVEGANQSVDSAFEIANSISPELNYYRVSVLPSLLSKVQMNIKAGFDEFALFELGTYHIYGIYKEDEPELPAEFPSLALVYAARHPGSSAAYFKAKNLLVYLLDELNLVDVKFVPLSSVKDIADNLSELAKPFDINRSALVVSGDKQWGVVGEFSRDTLAKLKLPKYSAGFEVDSRLFLDSHRDEVYKQISRFPSVKQDITLKVAGESNYSAIYSYLVEQLSGLAAKTSSYSLTPTSIFSPEGSDGSRNYTFHLVIADDERTLKDQEVNELLDKLAALAKDKLGAVRV